MSGQYNLECSFIVSYFLLVMREGVNNRQKIHETIVKKNHGEGKVGVGGRRHAAFPRPSRDPARGGGAAGRRLSSVINRTPILALLCAKNERVFAKIVPRSRQPCALVGDWAAIDVSLRPRVCISLQRVFGRFASHRFLVPLGNPRFSHICDILFQLLHFWCPLLGRLSSRNR